MTSENHRRHATDFIRDLNAVSRSRDHFAVFADFCRCAALSMESAVCRFTGDGERLKAVEDEWRKTMAKYERENAAELFPKMLATVVDALTMHRASFLGPVLEEIGVANKHNGQFFTPECVARLCADVNAAGLVDDGGHVSGDIIRIADPACGASVMLIEQGEALMHRHHVPQRDIFIEAGDVDLRACDISYVEMTLLGYAATVRHMDSLSLHVYSPTRNTFGFYLHGMPWRLRGARTEEPPAAEAGTEAEEEAHEVSQMEFSL